MRVLLATPAFGGMVTTQYVLGVCDSLAGSRSERIELHVYLLSNESLISRARNTCASMAMEDGYDKLMFVDGDIGWSWPDMRALLMSEQLVVGGTYPRKRLPPYLEYGPLPWEKDRPGVIHHPLQEFQAMQRQADPATGELEVAFVPAGFLMIDVRVLRHLSTRLTSYSNTDNAGPQPTDHVDFFPIRIREGLLETEYQGFCSLCRDHGIGVYLNTRVVLSHTGSMTFDVR